MTSLAGNVDRARFQTHGNTMRSLKVRGMTPDVPTALGKILESASYNFLMTNPPGLAFN